MRTEIQNSKCLVLNADYTPLKVIDWQKAILLSVKCSITSKCSVEIIEYYNDRHIHGVCGKVYKLPKLIRTTKYFNLYNKPINFSRKNLFIRDKYTCQYCGMQHTTNYLTYDHIIPKSRFKGQKHHCTNWENIVTACIKCNHKKGNRTPSEANMKLIKSPIRPNYSPEYLPWMADLDTIKDDDEIMKLCRPYLG
jgi:5-methylcytosine-specific restriction endonuclease McrA